MKKSLKKLVIAASLVPAISMGATLEERIAELEASQSLNTFKFSGTLITRFDGITVDDKAVGGSKIQDLNYFRMVAQLNMSADVAENMQFYGRLTTSKLMNAWSRQGTASTIGADMNAADNYTSSAVVLEKAYVDWKISESTYLSVGRLPTVDGQPFNYHDGRARLGTYPMLVYNSVLDGFAGTYKFNIGDNKSLAARAVYTPFTNAWVGSSAYLKRPTQDTTTSSGQVVSSGRKVETTNNTVAAQLEYSNQGSSWANNIGVIVQYLDVPQVIYPSGAGVSTLSIGLKNTSVAMEFQGVAGSNSDLSLSYLGTTYRSKGLMTTSNGNVGLGTTSSDKTFNGNTVLLSYRYNTQSWIYGAEVVAGSDDALYTNNAGEDLIGFYGVRGTGYHAYLTKKINGGASLRFGYMLKDEKKKPLDLGPNVSSKRDISAMYANLRFDF